ncbi:hypothetical protein P9112_001785 [Eukaryota sp. TZLM1-RC]
MKKNLFSTSSMTHTLYYCLLFLVVPLFANHCLDDDITYSIAPCPDGSCLLAVEQCPPTSCPADHSIVCSDGTCVKCLEDCTLHNCPSSTPYRCPDQSCAADFWDCPCPVDASFRCPNATKRWGNELTTMTIECRADIELCPHRETFCEPWRPIKCPDGACVREEEDCEGHEKECDEDHHLCNGFCVPVHDDFDPQLDCPLPNGCPVDRSILCETGQCVSDPQLCPLPYRCMDSRAPIKCLTGECVDNVIKCPEPFPQEHIDAYCHWELPWLCSNGKCVEKPEHCPAILPCPCGEDDRWDDGICRSIEEKNNTGRHNNCPDGWFRCSNGRCVIDPEDCNRSSSSCPDGYYRCSGGACVTDPDDCVSGGGGGGSGGGGHYNPGTRRLCNGCPYTKRFRCNDGQCAETEADCKNSNGCPYDNPHRCANGDCVADVSDCQHSTVSCPEGTLLCSNGECKSSCDSGACSKDLPYQCKSGDCVANVADCPLVLICPERDGGDVVVCDDYTFDLEHCSTLSPCPSGFVRCPGGSCASSFEECPLRCPPGTLYCNSACVTNPEHCFGGGSGGSGGGSGISNGRYSTNGRNGEGWVEFDEGSGWMNEYLPGEDDDVISLDDSDPFGPGWGGRWDGGTGSCRGEHAFTCADGSCGRSPSDCMKDYQCSSDQVLCSDGSCKSDITKCDAVPTCPFDLNKRCPDGNCVPMNKPCDDVDDECEDGEERCADGRCREVCPDVNGCGLEFPVFCPDGRCVLTQEDCVGRCRDEEEGIFQCIDGNCVNNHIECDKPAPFTLKSMCLDLIRGAFENVDVDILSLYDSEVGLGKFSAGSNALVGRNGVPAPLSLCTIDDSEVREAVGDVGIIATPVVKVEALEEVRSRQSADFELSLIAPSGLNGPASDYCLVKKDSSSSQNDTSSLRCHTSDVSYDGQFLTAKANEPGIYLFAKESDVDNAKCFGSTPYLCKSGECAKSIGDCPLVVESSAVGNTLSLGFVAFSVLIVLLL